MAWWWLLTGNGAQAIAPDTYGATSANIASAPALAIGDTAMGKAVEMLGFAPPAPSM